MNKYPKEYISECRSRVDSHVSAYNDLVSEARTETAGAESALSAAVDTFKSVFFNNMLVVLDSYFIHRSRTLEKKDGNPLNEVRVMCNSMMHHKNLMTMDKSIKLSPDESILGYHFGDKIALDQEGFSLISTAFFSEIESKYL